MKKKTFEKIDGMFTKYVLLELVAILANSVLDVTDGICVAQCVGDIGMSAVNVAWPLASFGLCLGRGIGRGASILMSNFRGKGKKDEVKKYKGNAISLLFGFTLLYFLICILSYKKLVVLMGGEDPEVYGAACIYAKWLILGSVFLIVGEGLRPILNNSFKIKECTIFYTITCILNLIGDIVLIFGLKMGVAGAAIATAGSEAVIFFGGLYVILRDKKEKLKIKHYMPDFKKIGEILKNSISPLGLAFADDFACIFYMRSCFLYGGVPAQAMYGVITYLLSIFGVMYYSVADGAQPLLSMANGYKDDKLLEKLMKKSLIAIVILTCIVIWGFYICGQNLQFIYNLSDDAMLFAPIALFMRALSMPIYGLTKLFISYNNSTCRIRNANILVYLETVVLTPILVTVLPKVFGGIVGVWATCIVVSIIVLFVALIMYFKDNGVNDIGYKKRIRRKHRV